MASVTLVDDTATIPGDDDFADLGCFASTDSDEDEIEENAEPLYRYNGEEFSSVFHPICIGDVLKERYRIVHKLGHGGFATVWLARDLERETDVALKILVSGESGEHEVEIQKEILQSVHDTSRLVTYLTTFSIPGDPSSAQDCTDKRNHQVLVFPWRGDCLYDIRIKTMPMRTRMSAARQLLEALENLHKAGIIHHDLNDRNCIWGSFALDHLGTNAKYQALGRPLKQAISGLDGLWKPGEIVKPLEIPKHLHSENFYLSDFGLAIKVGDPVVAGRPPIIFCSPERLHNRSPSTACDMWSYMCIFAELYLGFVPFTTFADGGAVTSIVDLLGPLPKEWEGTYIYSERSFGSWYDQSNKPGPDFNLSTMVARVRPDVKEVERELVHSILIQGFSYFPEKRLSATQLLQDKRFRDLMNCYS